MADEQGPAARRPPIGRVVTLRVVEYRGRVAIQIGDQEQPEWAQVAGEWPGVVSYALRYASDLLYEPPMRSLEP